MDPFYIVKQEIQETVQDLQEKMSRFNGLNANSPDRKSIAKEVEEGCESVRWQLNELENAVNKARDNLTRFNLTTEEVNNRQKWVGNTRRQIEGITQTLKTAMPSRPIRMDNPINSQSESFVTGEQDKQQLLMKQQDQQLGDMEAAVGRLGLVGLTIHEELDFQGVMLNELDEDVDVTHSRLKSAQKKIADVIRKSNSTTQLTVIAFLVVVLIILAIFTFY